MGRGERLGRGLCRWMLSCRGAGSSLLRFSDAMVFYVFILVVGMLSAFGGFYEYVLYAFEVMLGLI